VPYSLHNADCRDVLKTIPSNSVDSVATDPPYHLKNKAGGFLGLAWDESEIAYSVCMWSEVLRILRPGGHLLAFSAPRTYHRLACALENAGFEIRDALIWVHQPSIPKSLNIAKAIEQASGIDLSDQGAWIRQRRKELGITSDELSQHFSKNGKPSGIIRCWETGLSTPSPAQFNKLCELLQCPERKIPESELKITGYRDYTSSASHFTPGADHTKRIKVPILEYQHPTAKHWEGWGSNLANSHDPIALARKPLDAKTLTANILKHGTGGLNLAACTSNVVVSSKATKNERNLYLPPGIENTHPCPKPLELMKSLVRLVTPKSGTVLDPFMGSGTTGLAAQSQGFSFIGIEIESDYFKIAEARLKNQESRIKIR
jgi:DNA modification methylase